MPEEKPDLIGRIHKALGLKISPEQQAEIDRIKREGEAANAKLKEVLDKDLERVRRGLEETAAREHQEAEEGLRKSQEALAHMPKHLDTVNDMNALMAAARERKNIVDVRNQTTIYQWDDGRGNIVYLNPDVSIRQVQAVSARITEQKGAFDALGGEDQTRLKTEFDSSKGIATGTQLYKDFLQSDALGRRFQELKQSPPAPK